MQFWALCWAASVALAGALAAEPPVVEHHKDAEHYHETHDHSEDMSKVETHLRKVAYRFASLEDKIATRQDPKRMQRIGSLDHRIEAVEGGNKCGRKDFFQCGGSDPQCINNLLVCDHHKDCRNGHDEEHCKLPLKEGDIFVGDVVFDHCTKRQPEHMTMTILSTKTESFFPGFPKVATTLSMEYDRHDVEGHVTLWANGRYSFAKDRLTLRPPEADRLGFVAQFDGADFDTFDGIIRNDGSLHVCAKFIFHRKH